MEDFIVITSQISTTEEQVIYSNDKGVVIKTILLSAPTQTEAILTFDGMPFSFSLEKGTTVITTPILTKEIKATGDNVNLHVTGLQL